MGAAFTTLGILAAALCFLRRRFDALLVCFAVFAWLYGQRLWLQSNTLELLIPPSLFFEKLRWAVDFFVPIPAVLFLYYAGFVQRWGKFVAWIFAGSESLLGIAAVSLGPSLGVDRLLALHRANNYLVIAALLALGIEVISRRQASRDFVVMRTGLFVFIAFALCDNIAGVLRSNVRVEPYGFTVFLGTLGYVAARRLLRRDQQLTEIQKELDVAKRIQLSILPTEFPKSANFQVAARCVPMTSVAGDFYDFIVANEHEAGLLIADVSGHGVPAALIASMVKMAATSQRSHASRPASLLDGMNSALCGNTQNQFVTAAYVHLDAETAEIRYGAAGHPPMLVLRDHQVHSVEENGLILAAFESARYSDTSMPLRRGDRILLYTDGLLEASDRSGAFFGMDMLRQTLKKTSSLAAPEAVEHIIASVQNWSTSQDDDLTVLVCDYLGNSHQLPN